MRQPGFERADLIRLREAGMWARSCADASVGSAVLPFCGDEELRDLVDRHCEFSHVGLLLFPETTEQASDFFRAQGRGDGVVEVDRLVRRRIAERYRLTENALRVDLLRLERLNLYLLPRTCGVVTETIIGIERARGLENHIGIRTRFCDSVVVEGLLHRFSHEGLWFEGGAGVGDSTLFHFAAQSDQGVRPHRVELSCSGDHSALIRTHEVDVELLSAAYRGCVGL